jgi:uncharacterized membrane protein YkgB
MELLSERDTEAHALIHQWKINSQIVVMNQEKSIVLGPSVPGSPSVGSREEIALKIEIVGSRVLRYGLVLVVGWIGLMKFTGYEAKGIQPLVAHSPFLGWMYHLWSVRQFSAGLGVVEIGIAILIALRAWSPKACAIGSAIAVLMFLTTLSFLFSTPGWEPSLDGFPALSALPGQFLLKDVVLLGAAIWSLGEALSARSQPLRAKR